MSGLGKATVASVRFHAATGKVERRRLVKW